MNINTNQAQVLTSFCCSKCKCPLELDKEILGLNASSIQELTQTSTLTNNSAGGASPVKKHSGSRATVPRTSAGIATSTVSRLTVHSHGKLQVENSPAGFFSSVPTDKSFIVLPEDQEISRIPNDSFPSSTYRRSSTSLSPSNEDQQKKWLRKASISSIDDQNIIIKTRQMARIFNILSSKSSIDFPICKDCSDSALLLLEEEVERLNRERAIYEEIMEQAKATELEPVDEDELKKLEDIENRLLGNLKEVDCQNKEILLEIEALQKEARDLDRDEQEFWKEFGLFETKLSNYQLENESLNNKYEYYNSILEIFKKTNVYNDTFHIWHEGSFGTINGFRLGRLPEQHIEWSELNAAWGQACLLLDVLAQKIGFEFANYRLVPEGSFSKIEKVGDEKASYELYGSGEVQLSRLFWNRRFDQGMQAFLNCMKQMGEFAEKEDSSFKLPYKIDKDKIGDLSIKMGFNQDENWTKALKFMLTNLKWLLAFCCKYQKQKQ